MGLLQRLKHDLRAGLATLRHGTAHAASRALEETELLRIRLEIRKLDQRTADLYRDIGERTVELRERGEPAESILSDGEIGRLARQVQGLRSERSKLEADMGEIRSED